jgi:phosphocarrier protein FPr
MIGIVIVSHTAKLAEGVCGLAEQMGRGAVRLAAAGGTNDPENPAGTDAIRVFEAIQSVYSEDGVLVLMDLGSAVLSAETALELLDAAARARVRLCAAPLVEGAVAAVGLAAAGAGLDDVVREAEGALAAKSAHLAVAEAPAAAAMGRDAEQASVSIRNRLGLHARPAVLVVRMAATYQGKVEVRNATNGRGPVSAASMNGLLSLGARQGHRLEFGAQGPQARAALAGIASLIESGFGELEHAVESALAEPAAARLRPCSGQLTGLPASPGIGLGPLIRLRYPDIGVTQRPAGEPDVEWNRLAAALRGASEETQGLSAWALSRAGKNEAAIFEAQLLLLEDPALRDRASDLIFTERLDAARAWQASVNEAASRLSGLGDPYLEARAADVLDAGRRVLQRLAGSVTELPPLREPAIVAARDITPSEVKHLGSGSVAGICLEAGSPASHSTILARAMGIPLVVGLGPDIAVCAEGMFVALDGEQGLVWISPDSEQVDFLEARRKVWLEARTAASAGRHRISYTTDGRRITLLANIGAVEDAYKALEAGAEGVGVLRTEFLFLNRQAAPSEDEQYQAYKAIALSLQSRPLVIRTLDAGGDKPLAYLNVGEEANPFLGWRGIRLTLGWRDLFKTQLRAILRASHGHHIEILFPMVSTLCELHSAKSLLGKAKEELRQSGTPFDEQIKLGAMIEVPAAAVLADRLAAEVDFFSIGTNDLTQYVMAADRTNPRVSATADPLDPAVLRMILQTVRAAKAAGIGCTLCGELAADPLAAPLLIGIGLAEFSISAPLIPELKQAIARVDSGSAERLANEALLLDSGDEIRSFLRINAPRPESGST